MICIGHGSESTVYADPKHSNRVIKKVDRSSKYCDFIDAIVRNGMTGVNPYVPIIYSIEPRKFYKPRRSYQMERLSPLETLNTREASYILYTMTGEHYFQPSFVKIESYIEKALKNDWDDLNSDLKQLHDILWTLSDCFIDIHSHNLMIRYTSDGPQLVVTDPVIKCFY